MAGKSGSPSPLTNGARTRRYDVADGPPNGCIDAISSNITTRWQVNGCLLASGKSLTMFEDMIRSLKRTAKVVVRNPYGESPVTYIHDNWDIGY